MVPGEIRGPDLAGVVADANASGLEHVVIGGFAVIAHGYFRATKDSDLLFADGPEADEEGSWRGSPFRVASLPSLVGFKRLADPRPRPRAALGRLYIGCRRGLRPQRRAERLRRRHP
jgi:hypothetical protein